MKKQRIIVILGPTATGKSDLAVQVAKKVNGLNRSGGTIAPRATESHGLARTSPGEVLGEIISADSRQVYAGLNIGTGKISKREMESVPHHLLDVVSPKKVFSVNEWQKMAQGKIEEIIARGHMPIICGGSGFYIQSIVDGIVLPKVAPDKKLREKLEKKSVKELVKILKKLDPKRAKSIDQQNPVRLIRAIEIATALGNVPKIQKQKSMYEFVQIGLTTDPETLKKRIHTRLLARMKKGMIREAEKLHADGLSYARMRQLGLEYRYLADFLQNKISKAELLVKLDQEIYQYTRRQMAWFKRDKKILWFDVSEKGWEKKVMELL